MRKKQYVQSLSTSNIDSLCIQGTFSLPVTGLPVSGSFSLAVFLFPRELSLRKRGNKLGSLRKQNPLRSALDLFHFAHEIPANKFAYLRIFASMTAFSHLTFPKLPCFYSTRQHLYKTMVPQNPSSFTEYCNTD